MPSLFPPRRLPLLLTALAVALPPQARAETTPELVPVTVSATDGAPAGDYAAPPSASATGLELTPRQTPQSVSVVSAAQLEDFALDTVNEALETTPGVTVEKVETDRTYYTSRGFDITNFQFDGVGVPFVYGNVNGDMDTALYERVEIVRGATGLMSASGDPSATVNVVRKRPTRDAAASLALTAGSWDRRRAEGDVSGRLNASGSLRGRVVAAYEHGDSWLDRHEQESSTFYGVLEADLGEATTLALGHSLERKATNSPLWGALPLYYTDGTPTNYDVSTSTATDWAYWDGEDERSFVELAHDLGDGWTAKATAALHSATGRAKLFYVYGTPDRATGAGLFAYPSRYDDDTDQAIAEASIGGPFRLGGREHQFSAGVSGWETETTDISHYGQGIGTPLPPLESWNGQYPEPAFDAAIDGSRFKDRQASVFASTRLRLTDALATVLGARVGSGDSEGTSYGRSRATDYDNVVTPYAGLVYDLAPQHSLYASFTQIFAPQTEIDINRDRLDPTEGSSVEAGLKSEFRDGALNTALALFQTRQDNVAEAAGTLPGSATTYYIGVDGIESEGVELELSGEAAPGLQLAGGLTWLEIRDASGQDARTFIPRQTLRLAASYRPAALAKLKVGASATWQDDIERDQGGGITTRQDAYALLNLMARYDLTRQLSATVNVNNVTDEKYLTSLYWAQGYYGAPRNASVTLAWAY